MGHPTSKAQLQRRNYKGATTKAQLQRRNYKGEENRSCTKVSGLSPILAPAAGKCGKGAARAAKRVYNARNLLAGYGYF
jgi:hypothetical protein